MSEIWGLAVLDHDGDHFEWLFPSKEMAQHVADRLNPHRKAGYKLETVSLPLVEDEYDDRVQVEAIASWVRR